MICVTPATRRPANAMYSGRAVQDSVEFSDGGVEGRLPWPATGHEAREPPGVVGGVLVQPE